MRVFGNLMNRIAEGCDPPVPVVGMGATILRFSDRHACTIIEVTKNKRRIIIQRDRTTRTDTNGMSDSQFYEYAQNPSGEKYAVTLRKSGQWVLEGERLKSGTVVRLDARDEHYDFGF